MSDGNDAWHRPLRHTTRNNLSEETIQTPGMRRFEAISGKPRDRRRYGWDRVM